MNQTKSQCSSCENQLLSLISVFVTPIITYVLYSYIRFLSALWPFHRDFTINWNQSQISTPSSISLGSSHIHPDTLRFLHKNTRYAAMVILFFFLTRALFTKVTRSNSCLRVFAPYAYLLKLSRFIPSRFQVKHPLQDGSNAMLGL